MLQLYNLCVYTSHLYIANVIVLPGDLRLLAVKSRSIFFVAAKFYFISYYSFCVNSKFMLLKDSLIQLATEIHLLQKCFNGNYFQ